MGDVDKVGGGGLRELCRIWRLVVLSVVGSDGWKRKQQVTERHHTGHGRFVILADDFIFSTVKDTVQDPVTSTTCRQPQAAVINASS